MLVLVVTFILSTDGVPVQRWLRGFQGTHGVLYIFHNIREHQMKDNLNIYTKSKQIHHNIRDDHQMMDASLNLNNFYD